MTWGGQVIALTRKNAKLQYRARRLFVMELFIPCAVLVLLGILDINVRYGTINPHPKAIMTLSPSDGPLPCLVFGNQNSKYGYGYPIQDAWCVPIVYAPAKSTEVRTVMGLLAAKHGYAEPVTVGNSSDISDITLEFAPTTCGSGSEYDRTKNCLLGFQEVNQMRDWSVPESNTRHLQATRTELNGAR